jgi:chromosome segregation ATPase
MKSVQESKNELEAAIRYAENAISSAKQTIESMEFRQEMAKKQHDERAGREESLTKQVQELNANVQFHVDREAGFLDQIKELKEANMSLVCDNNDLLAGAQELESKVQGQYDQIKDLEREVQRQQDLSQGYYDSMMTFKAEVDKLRSEKEASSGPCGCQAYRDLEEKVGDLKDDLKDQREFDNEVRDAVEEFIEKLGTIGFEGA